MRKSARRSKIFAGASAFARASVLVAIASYRAIVSPLKPRVCRFYPSCSQYALQAVARHGVLRGLALALRRILRCHPLDAGGYDPVP